MSVPGVDYAWEKPSILALESAGEVFVAQYFSLDPSKNLTPARAAALQGAGIKVVVVWEYAAQAMRGGKAQGQKDAQNAETEAKACGVDGIPVYFACDYDAPPGDQDAIDAYLDGTASVLGDDRGRNIYGGYWPTSRARAHGKAKRVWGTLAWSGTNWRTASFLPDIMQGAVITIGGVQCDLDAGLTSDFGQWPRPATIRTWQEWETKGRRSLAQVADHVQMSPARVLRTTARHYGKFDSVTAGYVNDVLTGQLSYDAAIPAGGKLWVLR
jgi:hypothetical protein